jgi:hypothetical protein
VRERSTSVARKVVHMDVVESVSSKATYMLEGEEGERD